MTKRYGTPRSVAVMAAALFACSPAVDVSEGSLGTTSQAIIGGEPAPGQQYAAVGALLFNTPQIGLTHLFCSGTLVAPQAVVTARHCTSTIATALALGLNPSFVLGPDAFDPIEVVPITGVVAAPPGKEQGLLLDGGRDVAVAYLASAPESASPIALGRFRNRMLGSEFTIAGYGVSESSSNYGHRFAGTATARAIRGRWYKLLFDGDYEAFLDWYFTDSSAAQGSEEEAEEWWQIYRLESDYELLAGGLPGEAVACFGDSGGPLLLENCDGELATYGVSFAVEGTISTLCGLGGGYLVFNDKMLRFIEGAL